MAVVITSWSASNTSRVTWPGVFAVAILAVAAHLAVTMAVYVRRGRSWLGSLDEAMTFTATTLGVTVVLFSLNVLRPRPWLPLAVPLNAMLITLAVAGAARLAHRRAQDRRRRPLRRSAHPVIVFGAGRDGQSLVRALLTDRAGGYLPVALIDDDERVHGRRVAGVVVRGGRSRIPAVAHATGAEVLVVAVAALDPQVLADVTRIAVAAGLRVKELPPLAHLFRPWLGFRDLRDVDVTELLGRHPVDTDVTAAAGCLAGRTVLVTGAGGSIGSELCRQIHRLGPAELIMLDRDESALHGVQLSIHGRALLDTADVVLADIRDAAAIHEIFRRRRPDVVFHAAALKHLPMLEQYPAEAWKTNVLGTAIVLDAAAAVGVATFVNVSTDKAANPVSVLGRSKRVGERLVAEIATEVHGRYLSVRFGNVLGSRGSVVTSFIEQIAAGDPITVTHPDVTRYFMTVPEAVQLVIQAAAIGGPGEALVLDMGEPVRIVDLANQLMTVTGGSVPIVFTGLRKGEKLHEELFGAGERPDHRPLHPAISHVEVPPLSPAQVLAAAALEPAAALEWLVEDDTARLPVLPDVTWAAAVAAPRPFAGPAGTDPAGRPDRPVTRVPKPGPSARPPEPPEARPIGLVRMLRTGQPVPRPRRSP